MIVGPLIMKYWLWYQLGQVYRSVQIDLMQHSSLVGKISGLHLWGSRPWLFKPANSETAAGTPVYMLSQHVVVSFLPLLSVFLDVLFPLQHVNETLHICNIY